MGNEKKRSLNTKVTLRNMIFFSQMTRLFGSKEATRSFLSLSVLSFSEGSVVAEMSASFPSGSTLPRITDIMDALAEGTISDGSTDYPIDSSALVVEGKNQLFPGIC